MDFITIFINIINIYTIFCSLVVGIVAVLVISSTAFDILRNDAEDKLKDSKIQIY